MVFTPTLLLKPTIFEYFFPFIFLKILFFYEDNEEKTFPTETITFVTQIIVLIRHVIIVK